MVCVHTRTSDQEMVEVIFEMNIALYVLKSKIAYKYVVLSPRSVVADNSYEFIHGAPFSPHCITGYVNRSLSIPGHLQVFEGICVLCILQLPPS